MDNPKLLLEMEAGSTRELLIKIEADLTQILLNNEAKVQTNSQPDIKDIEAHFNYNGGCSFFKKYAILTGNPAKIITNDEVLRKCTVYVMIDTLVYTSADEKYFAQDAEIKEALNKLEEAHKQIFKYLRGISIKSHASGSKGGCVYDITPGSFASKSI